MDSEDDPAAVLTDFDLLTAPGHLLRRNHQRSFEIFARVVGDDVTRQQVALLIALSQNPGASQNFLVELTGFDKSTLKEMLGRMVVKGWVRRARDPGDQRAWRLFNTPEGARQLSARMARVAEAQRQILAPLPPALRLAFLRCLQILIGIEKPENSDDLG